MYLQRAMGHPLAGTAELVWPYEGLNDAADCWQQSGHAES
jgi:hypothetical protein